MEHNGRCVMLMRGGQILGCVLIMEPVGLRAELNVACGEKRGQRRLHTF